MGTLWVVLAAVVVIAGLLGRREVRRAVRGDRPVTGGALPWEQASASAAEEDPPLDDDEIRAAEDAFHEDDWGDPDAWKRG